MIFPVIFRVADHETSARIVSRLSVPTFWTEAGIRTVARDDLEYSPTQSWGLLGGVWVGMTFLFAQGLDTPASKDDWEEINFEFNSSVLVDGFPTIRI